MAINIFRAPASRMLKLGPFTFGLSTAAYDTLQRTSEYRWATIDRLDAIPAEQFIGQGSDMITLDGVIFPTFDLAMQTGGGRTAGTYQIERMRLAASMGIPHMMVDGRGNVLGRWIIVKVGETGEHFETHGAPQRQRFSIDIRKYGDLTSTLLGALSGALNMAAGSIPQRLAQVSTAPGSSIRSASDRVPLANAPIPTPRPIR